MNVIGIKGSGPDTAAALIADNTLTAVAEERLSRTRHAADFPIRSVKYLLAAAGIDRIDDVDLLVFSDLRRGERAPMEDTIRARLAYNGKVRFLGNHDAHAAAAFFASPFDDAAVLVADGAGNLCRHLDGAPHYLRGADDMHELQRTYRGFGEELIPVHTTPSTRGYPHGIIDLYEAVAAFLNFGPQGSGRVADLAAAGGRKPLGFAPFLADFDGDIVCAAARDVAADPEALARTYLGGLRPRKNQPLPDDIYTEIAHKVQTETSDAVLALARRARDVTRSRNLCVGGRIVWNGAVLTRLAREAGFESLFAFPAGDGVSVAAGCALWGAKLALASRHRFEVRDGCLGPPIAEEHIRDLIDGNENLKSTVPARPAHQMATRLAEGRVVAWYRKGSEAGPRGLGRRSVLADARDEGAMDRVRAALRRKEAFRPYGVAILEEFHRTYFDLPCASPWMNLCSPLKGPRAAEAAKGLAGYGAIPVQTVSKRTDLDLFHVLDHFYRLTGVPLLINAPLRASGQPPAETPADAVACFMNTGVDYLMAGSYWVEARGKKVAPPKRIEPIVRKKGVTARLKEALGFR